MNRNLSEIRVFIASPSDCSDERAAFKDAVESLNRAFRGMHTQITPLGWEDSMPGTRRPQDIINEDLDTADLVICCIWKKMGSPASTSSPQTGFEEEFARALDRKLRTGLPEIWLFFREVPSDSLADPGEALKQVVAFRTAQIQSKQILFKDFKDTAVWREKIYELLTAFLLKKLEKTSLGAEESAVSRPSESAPKTDGRLQTIGKTSGRTRASQAQLNELLKRAREAFDEISRSDPFEPMPLTSPQSTRLAVFAASGFCQLVDPIELGTHEINRLFQNRADTVLSFTEFRLVARTILLDRSLTRPGWCWIGQSPGGAEALLSYFAKSGGDVELRSAAIVLASDANVKLPRRNGTFGRVITDLLGDSDPEIRRLTLDYLAERGTKGDIRMAESGMSDSDPGVRRAARIAVQRMCLRSDADIGLKRLIGQQENIDPASVEFLRNQKQILTEQTLRDSLQHHDSALRALASEMLVQNGSATDTDIAGLLSDDSQVVKQWGYVAQAKRRAGIDLPAIRREFEDSLSFLGGLTIRPPERGSVQPILSAFLDAMDDDELEAEISKFNTESSDALGVLMTRCGKARVSWLRRGIDGEFERMAASAISAHEFEWLKRPHTLLSAFGRMNPAEEALRQVVDSACGQMAIYGDESDIPRFRRLLESAKSDLMRISCIIGLREHGGPRDTDLLRGYFDRSSKRLRLHAYRGFLTLSANKLEAVSTVLTTVDQTSIRAVVEWGIEESQRHIWPALHPLLVNDDEVIRRAVVAFAGKVLSRKSLKQVLDGQYSQPTYYYNVVTLLDRFLYAPEPLRGYYLRQEIDNVRTIGQS